MPILVSVLITVLVLYVVALIAVGWYVTHPLRIPLFLSPGALGLPQRSAGFQTADGVDLRGWWLDHPNPKSVVVLCHGYMMNRAEPIPLAKRLHEAGLACLVFDFRCHGYSGGKSTSIGPWEARDVAAAFAEARRAYPDRPIWIWGGSMGGAAAVLATEEGLIAPTALVLDCVYSRLWEANDGWWRTFLGPKIKSLVKPVWLVCWAITRIHPKSVDIAAALRRLSLPIWFAWAENDLIVPRDQAERNIKAAGGTAESHWFENCQHSQPRWFHTERYDARLFEFLRRERLID